MPGVEVEERHEEVDAHCGGGGDDQVCEDVVADVCVCCDGGGGFGEGFDDDVERGEGRVHHDDGVGGHGCGEHAFRALGAVAHGEDELGGDEEEHEEFEEGEYAGADAVAEGVEEGVGERAGDEVECEVEVCEGEVGEEKGDELVEELDVQEGFADQGMVGRPDLAKVDERVDCGEEGAVEPSPALGYKFRYRVCDMG